MSDERDTGLPAGWSNALLSDVVEINPRRFSEPPSDDQLVSFVPMASVEAGTGRLDPSQARPWSEVKRGYTPFQTDDVLFAKITPCMENGKFAVARGLSRGRAAGSTEFHVLRPTTAVSPDYLLHFVLQESFRRRAKTRMSGAVGQQRVPADYLHETKIPIPPISEQHRIVAAIEEQFTRLDAAVAGLKRTQANLKRFRAAVLAAACSGRLVPTEAELARQEGRDYEPADHLLQRILSERRERWEADQLAKMQAQSKVPKGDAWKSNYREPASTDTTELPNLPDGWTYAFADQLSDETRSITYGVIKLGDPVAGGVPTLRSSNVRHLRLDLGGVKRISKDIADNYHRTYLRGEEIVVTVRGTLGGVVVVPESCAGFNVSREVAVIALVAPEVGPCVASFIGSAPVQNWLMRNTKGIAYTGINIETLKQMPVPLPPLSEQIRIVDEVEHRLSVIEDLQRATHHALTRAERLRQSILRRAFEGKLVPQDPTDEPADVLLERIRDERASTASNGRQRKTRARKTSSMQPLFDLERVGETE